LVPEVYHHLVEIRLFPEIYRHILLHAEAGLAVVVETLAAAAVLEAVQEFVPAAAVAYLDHQVSLESILLRQTQ
jgi:hypothetical protein